MNVLILRAASLERMKNCCRISRGRAVIKVATGSGASQGTGPQTIAAQLARGVPADVVILSREGLSELIAANRIAARTDVDLAQVPLGVAVRAGTTKPDVSTVEAFRQRSAPGRQRRRAGKHQRHLADEGAFSAARHRRKNRRQGGTARLRCGRHGGRRNGGYCGHAGQRNRICARVECAGSIAPEIQFVQMFSAAVVAGTAAHEGAGQLIAFLASAHASEAIRNSGMEPLTARTSG